MLTRLGRSIGIGVRLQSVLLRGFKSRLEDMTEQKQEQKQKEEFMKDMRFFLSKEIFTLHDFHERVMYSLKRKTGIKTMLQGGDQEYSELDNQRKLVSKIDKICCTFFDEEKSSPTFLKSKPLRQEIATVAQVSEDAVQDLMEKFEEMQGLHEYLLKKRDKGEDLPQSQHELQMMLQQDKPKFLQKNEKISRDDITKEQRIYHLRRHHT